MAFGPAEPGLRLRPGFCSVMDVELPKLADTLVEGTVVRWLRRPGEQVSRGEPLVEVETDKVNTELEAPADGVLAELLAGEGETVPVGAVIARIAPAGGAAPTGAGAPPGPSAAGSPRASRLAQHLRLAASRVPQGVCAREVPAGAVERLAAAAARSGAGAEVVVLPPSASHLAMPALAEGQRALLAPGAERDGRRFLVLCYDRRAFDDWTADRLLERIAEDASTAAVRSDSGQE